MAADAPCALSLFGVGTLRCLLDRQTVSAGASSDNEWKVRVSLSSCPGPESSVPRERTRHYVSLWEGARACGLVVSPGSAPGKEPHFPSQEAQASEILYYVGKSRQGRSAETGVYAAPHYTTPHHTTPHHTPHHSDSHLSSFPRAQQKRRERHVELNTDESSTVRPYILPVRIQIHSALLACIAIPPLFQFLCPLHLHWALEPCEPP
ncbi:hypothetical protein LY76DRAFT_353893 [Colletotrichum caudatum]|nr:hypothetical protein LY76DRAFT_353893 [Colletotrichum caudatum]